MAYLLVTNDINPYYHDVVTLMALPHGCRFRFRYERSADLDLVGRAEARHLTGQQGAIIFRRRATAELIPIRRIRIHHVFESAYLIVPEFTVLDFPDPALREHRARLYRGITRVATQNAPGGPLCPLIFNVADDDLDAAMGQPLQTRDRQEDFDRWRSVTDSIAQFDFMTRTCFLYVHTIHEDDAPLPRSCVREGALRVRPETAYRVEFASYFLRSNKKTDDYDAVQEFKLTLKTDSSLAVPIADSTPVVSRYDNHNLSFRAKAGIEGVGTSVEIEPVAAPNDIFVPALSLPIYGRFAEWQWLSLVMGVISYVVSFKMSDSWQKALQAVGIILIAVLGKDSAAALIKLAWRTGPIRELRDTFREMVK
jgi:hypothetical protein